MQVVSIMCLCRNALLPEEFRDSMSGCLSYIRRHVGDRLCKLSDNNPQCLFFPTGVFSAFILCIVLTTEYSYVTSGLQMVAKGRDCTNLFPAVVKNVVSKNAEVLAAALGSSC